MSAYKTTKKVRYISSIIFVLLMTFLVGGSYLAQQDKSVTSTEFIPRNTL